MVLSFTDDDGERHEETKALTFEEFERYEVGAPVFFAVSNLGRIKGVYLPEDRPAE